jgi:hypothetical protein
LIDPTTGNYKKLTNEKDAEDTDQQKQGTSLPGALSHGIPPRKSVWIPGRLSGQIDDCQGKIKEGGVGNRSNR